jgi:hypothetical protein
MNPRKPITLLLALVAVVTVFPYTPSTASAEELPPPIGEIRDTILYQTPPLPPDSSDVYTLVLNATTGESFKFETRNTKSPDEQGYLVCVSSMYYYSSQYGADWGWTADMAYHTSSNAVYIDGSGADPDVYKSNWSFERTITSYAGSGTARAQGTHNGYFERSEPLLRRKGVVQLTVDAAGNCTARTSTGSW